jgi:hypothetical protein
MKLPTSVASALATKQDQRTDAQRIELAAYVLDKRLDRELAALPPPRLAYVASNRFKPDGSFKPSPGPRPIHVLKRGDVLHKGDEVGPGTLSLPGLDS